MTAVLAVALQDADRCAGDSRADDSAELLGRLGRPMRGTVFVPWEIDDPEPADVDTLERVASLDESQ